MSMASLISMTISADRQMILKYDLSLTCSMGGNNSECLAELNDYLHEEYLAKKGIPF